VSVILAGTSRIDQAVSWFISYIVGAPPWAKTQCEVAHLHHCSIQICLSVSQSVNSIVLLRGDKRKNKGFRDGERHCGLDPDIQESVAWPSVNNSCPFQVKCKSSQLRTLIQTTHTQLTCAEAQVYNHDNIEHAVKGVLTKPAKILRQGFFWKVILKQGRLWTITNTEWWLGCAARMVFTEVVLWQPLFSMSSLHLVLKSRSVLWHELCIFSIIDINCLEKSRIVLWKFDWFWDGWRRCACVLLYPM